jgi:hypothetical protein
VISDEDVPCARIPKLLGHDHSELDQWLERFFAAAKKPDLDESFRALDVFWARLAVHIRAEHLHLFPATIAAVDRLGKRRQNSDGAPSAQTARQIIAQLREDHDFFMQELAAAIAQSRKERRRNEESSSAVLSSVREKMLAVSERLQKHNTLEESEIYQWAEVLFGSEECIELNARMQKELVNLPARLLR